MDLLAIFYSFQVVLGILSVVTMVIAIYTSLKSLELQKNEVITQNNRIIELLESINNKGD